MGAGPPHPRNSEYFQEYPVLLSKLLGDFPNLSEKFPVISLNHCLVVLLGCATVTVLSWEPPVSWGLCPHPADAVQPQLVVA